MSKSILFYSNRCQHSKRALDIINKNNINIKLVSIDDKSIKLPSFLKVVPTIIEQGIEKPLEGDFVFKWLDRYNKQNSSQVSTQDKPNQLQDNSKIQPFFSNEMSGYSDGYSYLNNENPMDHSYQFINGIENTQKNMSSSESSSKEDEFNKQYEMLMEQRRQEVPNPIDRK
tara:strand:- start:1749 stop:2261 length:513 start_codon:yes stop_codon:yes gene_type:complete